MKKNIATYKLLILNIIPIILSIFSALAVVITVTEVGKIAKESQSEEKIIEEMNDLVYGLSKMDRNLKSRIISPLNKNYIKSYNDGLLLFEKSRSNLNNLIVKKEQKYQKERFDKIVIEGKNHKVLAQDIFELLRTNRTEEVAEIINLLTFQEIDQIYNEFLDQQKLITANHFQTLKHTLAQLNYFIVGNTILGLILATILGILIGDNLKKNSTIRRTSQKINY